MTPKDLSDHKYSSRMESISNKNLPKIRIKKNFVKAKIDVEDKMEKLSKGD